MEVTSVPAFLNYWEDCIPAERLDRTWQAGKFSLGDFVRHLAGIERYI